MPHDLIPLSSLVLADARAYKPVGVNYEAVAAGLLSSFAGWKPG